MISFVLVITTSLMVISCILVGRNIILLIDQEQEHLMSLIGSSLSQQTGNL
jgi:hypothetical protein